MFSSIFLCFPLFSFSFSIFFFLKSGRAVRPGNECAQRASRRLQQCPEEKTGNETHKRRKQKTKKSGHTCRKPRGRCSLAQRYHLADIKNGYVSTRPFWKEASTRKKNADIWLRVVSRCDISNSVTVWHSMFRATDSVQPSKLDKRFLYSLFLRRCLTSNLSYIIVISFALARSQGTCCIYYRDKENERRQITNKLFSVFLSWDMYTQWLFKHLSSPFTGN